MPDRPGEEHSQALAAWRDLLGTDWVVADESCDARYGPNISEYRPRTLVAALQPGSVSDVAHIVEIARRFGIALYPVSTGCNWGLGSKLPPLDGCAIVDLGRLNRIIEIDSQLGYAIVQPAVTQEMLASELCDRNLPWQLNVTGAGGSTSIVANALERGVGMLGQRHADIAALEVVLGTGEVMRLGFDHVYYPTGPGPDPTALFAQSSFGIVTSAALRLHPKRGVCLFFAETDADRFTSFIDGVRRLRQTNVLAHRTEIMADNDPRLVLRLAGRAARNVGGWGTWGAVYGDPPIRRLLCEAVRRGLESSCRAIDFFDQDTVRKEDDPADIAARLDLALGIPSNYSIESMRRACGLLATGGDLDLDIAVPGMLAVLPAVPLIGERLKHIVDIVNEESSAAEVRPVLSFSTVSEIAAEGFVRAHFDRRDRHAVNRVHYWAERLDARLRAERIPLLRLNLAQMETFAPTDRIAGNVTERLGALFDPDRIIAPGRYAPHQQAIA